MSPLLKKVVAAVAVKEGIEKIQEMRTPKPTLKDRAGGPLKMLTLGGGLFYLYKSGRLAPVVNKMKGLIGGRSDNSDSGVSSENTWSAPAATNGSTTSGTVSTSTTI